MRTLVSFLMSVRYSTVFTTITFFSDSCKIASKTHLLKDWVLRCPLNLTVVFVFFLLKIILNFLFLLFIQCLLYQMMRIYCPLLFFSDTGIYPRFMSVIYSLSLNFVRVTAFLFLQQPLWISSMYSFITFLSLLLFN